MGITITWDDDDKTILRYAYSGRWTWDELYVILNKGSQMAQEAGNKYFGIVDMRNSTYLPPGSMVHLKRVSETTASDPNYSGIIVFLKADSLAKAMLDFLRKLYPNATEHIEFIHVATLDEAHAKIARMKMGNPQP